TRPKTKGFNSISIFLILLVDFLNIFFEFLTMERRPNRPIDYLKNSMNKVILIKVKRNRLFRGK
ncbi:MAG: hypothetical protein ACFFBH_17360, partial [Promethearchaeota archaeon]